MYQLLLHSTLAFIFFILPLNAHASLTISEVFYDVPGSDEGKEWIEVYNSSTSPIDITKWRLRENGTNHKLSFVEGDTVAPLSYAVIADRPASFKIHYPQFVGVLIDSAFSLKNTSETLELLDENLNLVHALTYDSSFGGSGDGNSLSYVNGSWKVAESSPGNPPSERVLKVEPEKAIEAKPEVARNLSAKEEVVESDAIDESGGGGDVLAASYTAVEDATARENEGSGIMPWIALVVAVSLVGIASIFMKKRNKSGYAISEEEA